MSLEALNNTRRMYEKSFNVDGQGVFGIARVIGRNCDINHGKVRLYPLSENKSYLYLEHNHVESYPFAEPLSTAKGENHGVYYTPEFGDYVVFTKIGAGFYILGSVTDPSWKTSGNSIPVEAQNIQPNGFEYLTSHWPSLSKRGFHLALPNRGDLFHPASYLQRWRKNDFLIYNTTKMGIQPHSAAKLMELRSSENMMLQLVDIGNFNTKPGLIGKNSKLYSAARQTDYRDLWDGFRVNKEFWTERTDKPPLTNESQFIKLATNGHEFSEANHPDTGKDLPGMTRGSIRLDDREADGSHETTQTYCPIYQTVKSSIGAKRYLQDKPPLSPMAAGIDRARKLKKWIEDTGDPCDPMAQKLNVGHFLTLSNTIYKRRAMLSTFKGHQFVMSDVDKDEKVILSSSRGKYIYMEDGAKDTYDVMWLASQKHHLIFCDEQKPTYLIDDKGVERHRLVDPNQPSGSSYQLLQTQKGQKIWMADSEHCPRIHIHSTDGHEVLLLDHDKGEKGVSKDVGKGRIQITTSDGMMQITMDVENGDITIQNHNLGGKSGKTGDIKLYSAHDIRLEAKNQIWLWADMGMEVTSKAGMWNQDCIDTNINCGTAGMGVKAPVKKDVIRKTVLTKIDVGGGDLISQFKPS